MSKMDTLQGTTDERRPWPARLRGAATQAGRLFGLLAGLALLAIGLAVAAAALQAQRDETRSADALLVLAPELPPQALVDHTFDLYRRGYAPDLLLIGPGGPRLADLLRERGLPASALIPTEPAGSTWLQMHGATAAARDAGDSSALIVAVPSDLALALKMAHDLGLRAYGSPPPGLDAEPLDLLGAGLRYWDYALLQR